MFVSQFTAAADKIDEMVHKKSAKHEFEGLFNHKDPLNQQICARVRMLPVKFLLANS
jgi:hypothetical protein